MRDLMIAKPVTVDADQTIGEVVDEIVRRHRHSTYPVLDHGRPVGLLPFRCLAQMPRSEWYERHVHDCMVRRDEVPTLPEDEAAADALQDLAGRELGRALVVDDGHLAGLLSLIDLARAAQIGPRRR